MRKVKVLRVVMEAALLLFCCNMLAGRVIPVPDKVEEGIGSFCMTGLTKLSTNMKGRELKRLKAYLATAPSFLKNRELRKKSANGNDVIFLNKCAVEGIEHPEGYRLVVNPDGVEICAPTDAGLFYGLQTLLQMADSLGVGHWHFPTVRIEDAPRFDYRGMMIDVSRHFRSKEFLKKQIDALARYKINRLHLHLTDAAGWRIEIKKYPRLTDLAAWRPGKVWKNWWNVAGGRRYCEADAPDAYGGYYTQDDIRELVRYAADRHITIIPEIEMPAHSEEVLAAYPELSCSGEPYTGADFCVGNEKTFEFLKDVLTEVMDLFPSEYIHVGGDESGKQAWKTCPKCQKRIKDENLKGLDGLQSYLIHRVGAFLTGHGRKLMGWDEIIDGGLAPDATVMSWRGEEGGLKAVRSGHRAVMTPGVYCYFDSYQDAPGFQPEAMGGYLPLAKVYSYEPVPASFSPEEARLLYGVQANLWAEYITENDHYEYMMYPRLFALSEVAWSRPDRKSYEEFRKSALREVDWLRANGYNPFSLKDEIGNRPEASQPVRHLAFGKPVTYNAPYNEHYRAQGDGSLTDGIRGGWTYSDGAWQGFISRNRLDVTVDLEREEDVRSVTADFMQMVGPEVFLPAEVIVSGSTDGEKFEELTHIRNEVDRDSVTSYRKFGWEGAPRPLRYIRFQARSAQNLGGWIFTDEIVVQ